MVDIRFNKQSGLFPLNAYVKSGLFPLKDGVKSGFFLFFIPFTDR